MEKLQITHNTKMLDDLFLLHEEISSDLEYFKLSHKNFDYNIQLLIGENDYKIIIDIKNASRTAIDDKESGS